ncbi:MAG: hypothetical protein ACJ8FZ_25420 [Bradyrhizobium sp.]
MTSMLKRTTKVSAVFTVVVFASAAPALSQAPTDAQREAIKSQCRADYIAHCSSVPPGTAASLQCLQKNMSSLSGACASAVRAAEAPAAAPPAPTTETAAPKAEPAPSTATGKSTTETAAPNAAASTAAKQPSRAQISAIRGACRSDYPKVCAGVPTGGAPALQCLESNKAKLSAGCAKAVSAASGGAPAGAATTAPTAAPAAAPTAMVLRPMRPREEVFVLRSACGADVRAFCGGLAPGGGRIAQCLANNAASLSPGCKDVLAQFAVR